MYTHFFRDDRFIVKKSLNDKVKCSSNMYIYHSKTQKIFFCKKIKMDIKNAEFYADFFVDAGFRKCL